MVAVLSWAGLAIPRPALVRAWDGTPVLSIGPDTVIACPPTVPIRMGHQAQALGQWACRVEPDGLHVSAMLPVGSPEAAMLAAWSRRARGLSMSGNVEVGPRGDVRRIIVIDVACVERPAIREAVVGLPVLGWAA